MLPNLSGPPLPPPSRTELGRGRSGVVYRTEVAGRDLAVKLFGGDGLATLVHYFFSGAPNPYSWNENAVACALLRRQIVLDLLAYWFGPELTLAPAWEYRWNEEHLAFELDTQFVAGRPVALHQPYSGPREHEYRALVGRIMAPLQRRLAEAGFDGLVWQAGRGNPVAANNFLVTAPDGQARFTWIDLESGVPAFFPINPLDLLFFYLPASVRHRRPLFDDVDLRRLGDYLAQHQQPLTQCLGEERLLQLRQRVAQLELRQQAWKSLSRAHRGIECQRVRRKLTDEQAQWYRSRLLRWYLRELWRATRAVGRGAARVLPWLVRSLARLPVARTVLALGKLLISQRHRALVAQQYVTGRITCWEKRRQLTAGEATALFTQLESARASEHLADFGMHMGLRPLVKFLEFGVITPLMIMGLVPLPLGTALIVTGGGVLRSSYTVYRSIQALMRGHAPPWVALAVGVLPVVGNLAYAAQLIGESAGRQCRLAQFIIYDMFTQLGERLPIWGGRDTRTEHVTNRLGDWLVRRREALEAPVAPPALP